MAGEDTLTFFYYYFFTFLRGMFTYIVAKVNNHEHIFVVLKSVPREWFPVARLQ